MYIATIDAGTTNTRVCIWNGNEIIAQAGEAIGVRNTAIDGNNLKLQRGIALALQRAIEDSGCKQADVALVLASGMLTSNVGICEIPHVVAPAGKQALAKAMVVRHLPDVWSGDIWFVPGVKNFDHQGLSDKTISDMDIMRGEEVEVYGIMKRKAVRGATVIVLPGSHNKYIALNNEGEISGSMTTIAGELLHALTVDTIIADAVQRRFADTFIEESFFKGVTYYEGFGLGRASFMARILNQFAGYTPEMVQNYLLGMVLADDVRALRDNPLFNDRNIPVFVCGKSAIQEAYCALLSNSGYDVALLTKEEQDGLSGAGVIEVARVRGLIAI